MMDRNKFALQILKKNDARGYVQKAKASGFFIEAVVRLDLLIDSILELLFSLSCTEQEKLALDAVKKSIDPSPEEYKKTQNRMLLEKGILTQEFLDRIRKFKHVRNTMAHDIFGSINLVIEKRGEGSLKQFEDNERSMLLAECEKGEKLLDELLSIAEGYIKKQESR